MYIYIKAKKTMMRVGAYAGSCSVKKFLKFGKIQNSKFIFLRKESLAQVFSCEFCWSFKNSFFIEHIRWLFLMRERVRVLTLTYLQNVAYNRACLSQKMESKNFSRVNFVLMKKTKLLRRKPLKEWLIG